MYDTTDSLLNNDRNNSAGTATQAEVQVITYRCLGMILRYSPCDLPCWFNAVQRGRWFNAVAGSTWSLVQRGRWFNAVAGATRSLAQRGRWFNAVACSTREPCDIKEPESVSPTMYQLYTRHPHRSTTSTAVICDSVACVTSVTVTL